MSIELLLGVFIGRTDLYACVHFEEEELACFVVYNELDRPLPDDIISATTAG